jgi:hypothetical protein
MEGRRNDESLAGCRLVTGMDSDLVIDPVATCLIGPCRTRADRQVTTRNRIWTSQPAICGFSDQDKINTTDHTLKPQPETEPPELATRN